MHKFRKIKHDNFGEGWGKFIFDPQYLLQVLNEAAKILSALRHLGDPLPFWISRPYP